MIIAVINQKGGVGKTTTTVNLGAALAEAGYRVLLIDLDRQQSLLHFDVTDNDKLVLAAATPESLAQTLSSCQYDFALLDCPPVLDREAAAALLVADIAVAPTPPRFLEIAGFALLRNVVQEAVERGNPGLKLRILVTMRDARAVIQRDYEGGLRQMFGGETFETTVPRSLAFEKAADARASVVTFEPKSSGASAYRALAQEVIKLDHRSVNRTQALREEKTHGNNE